jgi:hypothetical protein
MWPWKSDEDKTWEDFVRGYSAGAAETISLRQIAVIDRLERVSRRLNLVLILLTAVLVFLTGVLVCLEITKGRESSAPVQVPEKYGGGFSMDDLF